MLISQDMQNSKKSRMNIFKPRLHFGILFLLLSFLSCSPEKKELPFTPIVTKGETKNAIVMGEKWTKGKDFLECSGEGDNFSNMLYSSFYVQDQDFHIKARLSLEKIEGTTAIFWFFNNHFGFDSSSDDPDFAQRLFIFSPKLDSVIYLQKAADFIFPGKPFSFEIIRKSEKITFFINSKKVCDLPVESFSAPLKGTIAFRPWRNTLRIFDWSIQGDYSELPDPEFVFESGEGGYACFRIPSIIQTNKGTLLAFAEGREGNCRDNYDVNIVMKKSFDEGETWSDLQLIWEDSSNTCSYPVPIVDRETGRISLFSTWSLGEDHWGDIFKSEGKDTRRIFLFHSEDDGESWTSAKEITADVKRPNWDYYGIGTGSGLQIKHGKNKGRMIAAAYHSTYEKETVFRSHLIYSDDGGLNWQIGGISPETGTSECEVAELNNGELMLNMTVRSYRVKARSVAVSHDGGLTLKNQKLDPQLIGARCQASLESYFDKNGKAILLFSNPRHQFSREDLTAQFSTDGGENWKIAELLFEGYAANSDLIVLNDGTLGCFFECGKVWTYDGLVFKKFELPE